MVKQSKKCNVCFEFKPSSEVSYCLNCLESGNTCYVCEENWVKNGNSEKTCIICKKDTKQNINKKIIKKREEENEINEENEIRRIDWIEIKFKCLLICLLSLMCYLIYLMCNYIIYYEYDNGKNNIEYNITNTTNITNTIVLIYEKNPLKILK
tara:strand:- start:85 stop:543 length:459 start_codon:yes stop_codon:yes gene_type:complete